MSRNPDLVVIERKIGEARRRWLESASDSDQEMADRCERFVNDQLDRWLKVRDREQLRELTK